ncbi:probable 2-oxoglutarate-dependent dioxygenase AOP1 [Cornus florida]|uniref:probable 2-oxoglutarate-dependent dioxygenase AOP1 n=1 Tax=Cornus florida TaxID=4283 RepID=UPI00289AE487|nr:probable 2-oxoglutarate-dependent dioxygenase AOP1 [Cornus florida]
MTNRVRHLATSARKRNVVLDSLKFASEAYNLSLLGEKNSDHGFKAPPKLPTISFTTENLKPGSSSWIAKCNDVRQALEDYGCFEAVYDKVSLDLDNNIFSALEELFDLPTETEAKNTSEIPYFGYIGNEPLVPLYESMGIDNAATLEETQSFTNIMWSAGNDFFCETVHSYSKLVTELEQAVKRMVFESYGVGKYYDSHIGSTTYILKLMKYRGPLMNETNIGVSNHMDKSFITILHQNKVYGLVVKTKDGVWIGFEHRPSSFIVMAGDAFLAWSNNRVHSPNHRVIMSGNEVRYSIGLFEFNKGIMQVPEELVDDEHPRQFKPFNHFGLLDFYYIDPLNRGECMAKAYCGV